MSTEIDDAAPQPNPPSAPSREACASLDALDALAPMRARFQLPDDTIYLDGNSLGALPKATAAHVADVIARQWGNELIGSWNTSGWIDAPRRIGDAIAPLIGAAPGEVIVCDSTSVNLFKVLSVALDLARSRSFGGGVLTVLSEASNFPTDLYVAQGIARFARHTMVLRCIDPAPYGLDDDADAPSAKDAQSIVQAIEEGVDVLMLTHVNYRSGAMHDMNALTKKAHDAGALVIWDLAHSAGAVPVDLHEANADFAVGCGYKYLNGGPGAPAFLWVHPRHGDRFSQPLSGWMGHAKPFAFDPAYTAAEGISRFLCGTPPILSMAALECGIASLASPDGQPDPMMALREKSIALTDLFIALVEERCAATLRLASPRTAAWRGSQVGFHPHGELAGHGYALMQALIECGVIGDFRKGATDDGDILRFGFAPAYLRFVDVFDAAEAIADALASGAWRDARFQVRAAVT